MNLPRHSLVRLLLNIDEVQPRLVTIILKRFTNATKEERPLATEVNLPSLILSQMAWLNRIIEPTLVVDTLLNLLNTSNSVIKKEIISHLAAIAADKEQIRVAFALCDLLNENNSLTAAVLDALGDLSLPYIEASKLRNKIAKRILAVPMETIPVLITFVFKKVQPDEASKLVQEIRLNFDRSLKKRDGDRVVKETLNDCISLAIESLQNSMMRSKPLADAWFKGI